MDGYSATVGGGHHHHHGDRDHDGRGGRGDDRDNRGFGHDKHGSGSQLTQGEHEAARAALAKLGAAYTGGQGGHGSSSGFKSAQLLHGSGNDTFAGGVGSSRHALSGYASDTVDGGSWTRGGHDIGTAHHGSFALTSDTINLAGHTAAGVLAQDHQQHGHGHGTHSVTLADKTTLNITGVPSSSIKPHNTH